MFVVAKCYALCALFVVRCLLVVVGWLLCVCRSLRAVRCVLFVVCLCVEGCWSLVMCCLLSVCLLCVDLCVLFLACMVVDV